ncbi:hypothetical protein F5880DRAFT_1632824 [Lentinula raphanica]|nr:hypothetical protein F5880DRAFT_1632824 [Lentinula raphanica]
MEFGCRRNTDEESTDMRVVAQMLTMEPSSSTSITQDLLDLPPPIPPTIQIQGSPEEAPETAPINILWDTTWVPPPVAEMFTIVDRSPIFKYVSERYHHVFDTEELGFMIKAETTHAMVQEYTKLVRKANIDGDFTAVLSEHRHFQLVNIEPDGSETYITSGPGVEKEVMSIFFKSNFSDAASLLTNVIDDYTTLATVPMLSASDISPTKKDELTHFGSVVGLSLIHGVYPANLNPLLLTLSRWLALRYDDNSNLNSFQAHFATYHYLPVAALRDRSERLHQSLACTMLHNAIVGPETVEHPYFKAFLKGLLLPCGILGVDLSEIARRFSGGDYSMLRIDYIDHINGSIQRELEDALSSVFPALSDKGFPAIFREFLEGSGLPPPLTIQGLRGRFADIVSLDDVSNKGFRMKMFCWATTGVPHILLDGSYTEVCLIADNSPQYLSHDTSDEERAQHLNNGTCCFKTCTRMMLIPASYLLKLLRTPSSNPQAVMDAISSWLFLQILDGVGNYNVL